MRRSGQEIIEKMQATQSIHLQLLLALYDVIGDKERVIAQFSEITKQITVHTLYSEMSDAFYDEFEAQRAVILQMLADARAL